MEVLHPIKVGIPALSYGRKANQFQPSRMKIQASVSCSQVNLTRENEELPVIQSDWRAFRARLVATERSQAVAPQKPALMADPNEEKWVHTIPEPEKGCLLIATEKLDGNHVYKKTVILVLSSGEMGLTGLILNRPSFMSGPVSDRPLYFGGPLFEGLFLVNNAKWAENGEKPNGVYDEVMKGLYYGSMESSGFSEIGDCRHFDGYCAWEGKDLRDQIRAGYWTVAACSPNVTGLNNSIGLWEEINGLAGHKKVC